MKAAAAILVAGLLLWSWPGEAQTSVLTIPIPGTTTGGNVSGTVASTNVFQSVFAATGSSSAPGVGSVVARRGCTIVNNSSHNMWVTEGYTAATADKTHAVVVLPSGGFTCGGNGTVLIGEIDITGTSGDAFYAAQF